MTQTAYGQTHALAIVVAEALNAMQASGEFAVPILAKARFRLMDSLNADDLNAIPPTGEAVSVDVFPGDETSVRQGMSPAFASVYTVHIFMQQKLGADATDDENQCGLLTQTRSEIIEAVKMLMFDIPDAVHPATGLFMVEAKSADKVGVYDLPRLLKLRVYESDTILTFKAAV